MKRILVISVLILLVMPLVLSSTDIVIKTLPNHKVDVIVRESGKLSNLESFINKDSGTGELTITTSADKDKLDLLVSLKKDVKKILNEKFEGVSSNDQININLIPGSVSYSEGIPEQEVNDTAEEIAEEVVEEIAEAVAEEVVEEIAEAAAEEVVEESAGEVAEEKQSGKISGAIVGAGKAVVFSKITYFIIAGMFILFFIILIAKKKLHSKKGAYVDFKIKDKKDEIEDKTDQIDDKIEEHDEKLLAVENKIKEAKQELDQIRDRKKKLQEARERFERNRAELERLERGD